MNDLQDDTAIVRGFRLIVKIGPSSIWWCSPCWPKATFSHLWLLANRENQDLQESRNFQMSIAPNGYACPFSCIQLFMTPWMIARQALCPWSFPGKNMERVAISYSRGSPQPWNQTLISCIFCIWGAFFTTVPPGKPLLQILFINTIDKVYSRHLQTHTHTPLWRDSP